MATKFSKVENEIEELEQLLDDIKSELNCIEGDWDDLSEEEQQRVPSDLRKVATNIRSTAQLFSWITPTPDWSKR